MQNLDLKEAMKIAGQDPNGMFALSLEKTIQSGQLDSVAQENNIDLSMFGRPKEPKKTFKERIIETAAETNPVLRNIKKAVSADTRNDIKETVVNIKDTAFKTAEDFTDIAERSSEQKASSTALQGAGQGLGTVSNLFGDLFLGTLKTIATPEQEELATKAVTRVVNEAMSTEIGQDMVGGVELIKETYEGLKQSDPEKAANMRAKLQIVEALTELLGVGSAKRIAGQTDTILEQAFKKADDVIANPAKQEPELIAAIADKIDDTTVQFEKVRNIDEALVSTDTGITSDNANIAQKLVVGDDLLSARDKKRLLNIDPELGNKYLDILEKSEIDDTAPPVFEAVTQDVQKIFDDFEVINKKTGSRIGAIKEKLNTTPVDKPKVIDIISDLDSTLKKKGLKKGESGLYEKIPGSNSPFSDVDVKNINNEIVQVLDNIKNAKTNEQLVLGMESLGNKINYNLDTSISGSLQGLSKKVDGQLRGIRNSLLNKKEAAEFQKYTEAKAIIDEFKKSDNKIKTLINREDSMRAGELQSVSDTLKKATGKDMRDNTRLMKILIDASPQGGTNRSLLNQRIVEGASVGASLATGKPIGALREILRMGGKKIFDVDKLQQIKKAIDFIPEK